MAATVSYGSPLDMAKSVCYQLLPFMFERHGSTAEQDTEQCCVIINSPLLSLMVF